MTGVDRSAYDSDRLLRLGIQRLIEIIGEALNKASKSELDLIGPIPNLGQIIRTRHKIVHGYDSIDRDTIWEIASSRIADLQVRLLRVLTDAGYDEDLLREDDWI
jgi:uncharacterized protein with HEPN domain